MTDTVVGLTNEAPINSPLTIANTTPMTLYEAGASADDSVAAADVAAEVAAAVAEATTEDMSSLSLCLCLPRSYVVVSMRPITSAA